MGNFRDDVAAVAYAAALAHKQGKTTYKPFRDAETMNLVEKGYCARFVRQCHEAAMQVPPFGWPYAAANAREMEKKLRGAGKTTNLPPKPGDVIGMNGTAVDAGHIGIYLGYRPELGEGQWIAHNTAGKWGGYGPGTCFTPLGKVAHIVSGYFAVLPSKPDPQPERIVVRVDGVEVDCNPKLEAGVLRVELRAIVEALGQWPDTEAWPLVDVRTRA